MIRMRKKSFRIHNTVLMCIAHIVVELAKMFCHIYLELDPLVLKHRIGCLVQEKYVLYVVLERA
jgi:hypothetical protein